MKWVRHRPTHNSNGNQIVWIIWSELSRASSVLMHSLFCHAILHENAASAALILNFKQIHEQPHCWLSLFLCLFPGIAISAPITIEFLEIFSQFVRCISMRQNHNRQIYSVHATSFGNFFGLVSISFFPLNERFAHHSCGNCLHVVHACVVFVCMR